MVPVIVGYEYFIDFPGIETEGFHVGAEDLRVTTGIEKQDLLIVFDPGSQTPGIFQPLGGTCIVIDHGDHDLVFIVFHDRVLLKVHFAAAGSTL